ATPTSTTTPPVVASSVPALTGWPAFDDRLQTILDDGSSAVSATVLRDGEIVHEVALGTRTSAGDPVEIGDRYRIASISKVITAITTLRLVDQGLLELDEPVGERLAARVGQGSPSSGVSEITTRDLLTHRSGIGQYENLMFARQVESCPEAGAIALGQGLDRPPDTTFRYSNVNFCLLGQLIEDVTGEEYADVVAEQLLDPLDIDGMRLAGTFDVSDGDVAHASAEGRNYMEVLEGAGSWIASPTDVATIVDSLDPDTPGWKALSPATNAAMRTVTLDPPVEPDPTAPTTLVPEPPRTAGYGMGLMIFGPESFGHTGTVESTHAMTLRQPDGLTWAITVSGDAPSSSRDLATIINEALTAGGLV
ncbi:serine hydrolase domain-containing protein, partial [Ilumatobacter sp.]|uniref:serine hydrolase domain-containing protein n=1 Tax=Ilumatobacter sp. TaxID=1967498 RepID=UPI003C4B7CE2